MVKEGTSRAKVSRRRRHRSLENKQKSVKTNASQSTRLIHVSVRSTCKTSSNDKPSVISHKNTQPMPDHTKHHHRPFAQNSFKIDDCTEPLKKTAYSDRSINFHPYQPSIFDLTQYSINRISPEINDHSKITVNSSKLSESKIFHSHSSRLGIITEHHGDTSRKTKKTRKYICIGVALLIGFLLLSSIIIILSVLLTRPKTKTTINPSEVKLRWNPNGITVAGISGQAGGTSDHLISPFTLAIDHVNTLYISDSGCNRIQRWFKDASSGTTVAGNMNCMPGINSTELNSPASILLDSDNNMYIADSGNSRVIFWPNGATSGSTIAGTGTLGNANNQLYTPFGISRDSTSGTLYIADYGNHRIMRYLYNATHGTIVAGGNGPGTNSSQFNYPSSVHFDSLSNSLIVVNCLNNNIVRWKIGDNNWTLITGSANGSTGSTSTLFYFPLTVILDPMGNMYVTDVVNHRIQFFLSGEANGTTIAGVSTISGGNATLLSAPYGIALDNQLNLYVADTVNHRIQKFLRY